MATKLMWFAGKHQTMDIPESFGVEFGKTDWKCAYFDTSREADKFAMRHFQGRKSFRFKACPNI